MGVILNPDDDYYADKNLCSSMDSRKFTDFDLTYSMQKFLHGWRAMRSHKSEKSRKLFFVSL